MLSVLTVIARVRYVNVPVLILALTKQPILAIRYMKAELAYAPVRVSIQNPLLNRIHENSFSYFLAKKKKKLFGRTK